MVATLTRIFGVHNLALAEDVVQDAFCRALEVWKFRGVPENPSAWLMATAKNRALDVLRRERTARTFAPELGRLLESEWTVVPAVQELFGANAIKDDLLRMMFSCCHPRLPEEAQVALMLHILCGPQCERGCQRVRQRRCGDGEAHPPAPKKYSRGRSIFSTSLTPKTSPRVFPPSIARSICSSTKATTARRPNRPCAPSSVAKPCASRRCSASIPWPQRRRPMRFSALMCLHAARLPARLDAAGDLRSLFDQDRSVWDASLIAEAGKLLDAAAAGSEITDYHLEAAMAWVHTTAHRAEDTDWETIVLLYDRTDGHAPFAGGGAQPRHRRGPVRRSTTRLAELRAIAGSERLSSYPFYHAALGEFEFRSGKPEHARGHFVAALALARNPTERRFLDQRIAACTSATPRHVA